MPRATDANFHLRHRVVLAAHEPGVRAGARAFRCSRNTVRKWLRRFQQQGKAGRKELSRTTKRIPHKTPPQVEQAVL